MLYKTFKILIYDDYLEFFFSGCVGAEWVVLTVTIPVMLQQEDLEVEYKSQNNGKNQNTNCRT